MPSHWSLMAGACLFAMATPARADDLAGPGRIARLEQQVAEQREQIARLERLLSEQGVLIDRLTALAPPAQIPASRAAVASDAPPPVSQPATEGARADLAPARGMAGLDISGDLRLREEVNFADRNARARSRTVLRARLRATYAVSDHLSVGTQIATGDSDDPNSTDITLGGFDDDLDISLDQAWIRYRNGGLTLYGGKFPQIFERTDMLWDGDVVPEGVGGTYRIDLGRHATLEARAMYFIVDEAPDGRDSHMVGAQAVLAFPLARDWRLSLAGAHYRYRLPSLAGADGGDIRTNLYANGRYLSGFRLVEGLATLSYAGFGPHWPISLTADYVHNLGAVVRADTAFDFELAAGRLAEKGEWRLSYAYSRVGVDAVFAAFSQDNIAFGSNYLLHGLNVGYMVRKNMILDINLYHYRMLDRTYAGPVENQGWLNRIRANFMVQF